MPMNVQTKTAAILIATLLLGVLLGALLSGMLLRRGFETRLARMRTPPGFINRFEAVIQPDESQREELRRILAKHARRFEEYRAQFPALMDSLRKDLDPILTDEQKQRLRRVVRLHERGRLRPRERPWRGRPRRR